MMPLRMALLWGCAVGASLCAETHDYPALPDTPAANPPPLIEQLTLADGRTLVGVVNDPAQTITAKIGATTATLSLRGQDIVSRVPAVAAVAPGTAPARPSAAGPATSSISTEAAAVARFSLYVDGLRAQQKELNDRLASYERMAAEPFTGNLALIRQGPVPVTSAPEPTTQSRRLTLYRPDPNAAYNAEVKKYRRWSEGVTDSRRRAGLTRDALHDLEEHLIQAEATARDQGILRDIRNRVAVVPPAPAAATTSTDAPVARPVPEPGPESAQVAAAGTVAAKSDGSLPAPGVVPTAAPTTAPRAVMPVDPDLAVYEAAKLRREQARVAATLAQDHAQMAQRDVEILRDKIQAGVLRTYPLTMLSFDAVPRPGESSADLTRRMHAITTYNQVMNDIAAWRAGAAGAPGASQPSAFAVEPMSSLYQALCSQSIQVLSQAAGKPHTTALLP